MKRYYAVYKPFGMLSQFSSEGERPTLAALGEFEKDVYPVGRLDADSEGLLILTNDKSLNHKLLHPRNGHRRTYFVQVEGQVDEPALRTLRAGVEIRVKGKVWYTAPAEATSMNEPELPERNPPVRFRKNIPTSWISLRLVEGKNRQVRRMTAAVGFPTLRLVRWAIEELNVEGYKNGEYKEYSGAELKKLLKL
jgi:23S rRNA pseudouridine2457 synthase